MAAELRAEAGAAEPEYVTDVAYVRQLSADLAPPLLRLVAALNGFTPPSGESFDYCELGSGHGDTTATLAAAHPLARFVGVDFNPAHTAFASGLAGRGGLSNVRFLERDFAHLAREPLPDFDYVGANGVFTWVSPEKRRAVLEFCAARLKPGGLLYLSYNALPGWAAVEPLRRLVRDSASAVSGTTLDRARHGLQVAKRLAEAGAEYFAGNPAAREMLATMEKTGLAYVAHEYFHAHWNPRYFADTARELGAHGLHFIGQLPLHLNYRDLALPPPLVQLFKGVQDRVAFEGLKDFALNEFFRRDVFVKGAASRSDTAAGAHLDATAFGPVPGVDGIQREARLPHYTLRFAGAVFDAVIPALTSAPAPVAELVRHPELAPFGAQRLRDAVLRLALGGQVAPMQRAAPAVEAPPEGRYRIALPYNRMILQQPLSTAVPVVLASPVAGTGVIVPLLQAVALRLLTEVPEPQRPAWLRAFVERQPLRLRVDDRAIEGVDEQARILAEAFEELRLRRLPRLLQLGILAREG